MGTCWRSYPRPRRACDTSRPSCSRWSAHSGWSTLSRTFCGTTTQSDKKKVILAKNWHTWSIWSQKSLKGNKEATFLADVDCQLLLNKGATIAPDYGYSVWLSICFGRNAADHRLLRVPLGFSTLSAQRRELRRALTWKSRGDTWQKQHASRTLTPCHFISLYTDTCLNTLTHTYAITATALLLAAIVLNNNFAMLFASHLKYFGPTSLLDCTTSFKITADTLQFIGVVTATVAEKNTIK